MRRHGFAICLTLLACGIALALFAPMHSGARGLDLCHDQALSGPGTVSWWPPGTTCEGGEPPWVTHYLSETWVAIAAALLAAGVLLGLLIDAERRDLARKDFYRQ
jgi:hypothetical protein